MIDFENRLKNLNYIDCVSNFQHFYRLVFKVHFEYFIFFKFLIPKRSFKMNKKIKFKKSAVGYQENIIQIQICFHILFQSTQ